MDELERIIRKSAVFSANYRHIPAANKIEPFTGFVDHARPVPGGISAEMTVTWTAKSPILAGGDKDSNGVLLPQRLYPHGPFCISGRALGSIVKAAYSVATNSAFTPINRKHGIFPKSSIHPTMRQEYPVRRIKIYDRQKKLDDYDAAVRGMDTIAAVAARTYGNEPTFDWATALFGFVKDGEHPEQSELWQLPINFAAESLKSRVDFGFAVAEPGEGKLWPGTHLAIPGAEPKVTFEAGYLSNPENAATETLWNKVSGAKLAGLKVYPVFEFSRQDFYAFKVHDGRKPELSDVMLRLLCSDRRDKPLVFTGQIHCHNLHPAEFGALIWAITLGEEGVISGQNGNHTLRHNVGHLKAFGAGQLEVSLIGGVAFVNPDVPSEGHPEGRERSVKEGNDFAEFCRIAMLEFDGSDLGKNSRQNRILLQRYKNPEAGNILRKDHKDFDADSGLIKRIHAGLTKDDIQELTETYKRIRHQSKTINDL